MPKKLDKCIEQLKEKGKNEASAFAICKAAMKDEAIFKVDFSDELMYDEETKSVVSVRDGVQIYYGVELGLEPPEKQFKVYRAPETIKAIVDMLPGIPVTGGHVPLASEINDADVFGKVLDAEIIDAVDENVKSTVKIKNRVKLEEKPLDNKLSLGYFADLVPCELYDFEQVDIVPHHLAVVERGRCGDMCKFTDHKGDSEMSKKDDVTKVFLDANGQVNMQQVLELVAGLTEVVKKLDIKELAKVVPKLQQITELAAQSEMAEGGEEMVPTEGEGEAAEGEVPLEQEAAEAAAEDVEDEMMSPEEKKKEMMDSAEFADAVAAKVATEVSAQTKVFASVVSKARDFLDADFDYGDKSAEDVMRAALATQHTESFEDSELSTAFKLLKKTVDYSEFGDAQPGDLAALADKEI